MKALLRSPVFVAIAGRLIWAWMALVGRTVRWRVEGAEDLRAWIGRGDQGIIATSWHETIMLIPSGWTRQARHWPERRSRIAMMVSLSPDGAAVAEAIRHLDLDVIRGSKSNKKKADKDKGGIQAIAEASRRLRDGGIICMTPDGPRGPRRVASAGAVTLAQRAGAVLVPYAVSSKPAPRLDTWDRFILPLPFARGGIVFGAPIACGREDDPDMLRAALQGAMDAATARADLLAGYREASGAAGAAA
jgi:lysophospholipid acyltransferase (LPLAT)-like uncharacterized protein